ncbi:MAG: hypothetical protein HC838_09025 [Spirulinaceae cyanobacterium RM2_2_10]|nr:hypothetical protein [Spirulinaceae cyanobacterium SM2_1_0]NJO20163.1 hypothetical protein [Spirulinaceae cyanobacterium RM2_2_10]
MSTRKLTIELPEQVFTRLARLAELLSESPEAVAADSIARNLMATFEHSSQTQQTKTAQLNSLSDEALLQLATSQVSADNQERHLELLEKNQHGTIDPSEQKELAALRQAADQLMLRKALAWDTLGRRGRPLPSLQALSGE